MRVVAGMAGGIPLRAPGSDARPSMDKVRGAVFSSLGDSVVGVRVLDLFAGSGAYGIEALSRGASHCIFVERDRRAVEAIHWNLRKCRMEGAAQVVCGDAMSWTRRGARGAGGVGLVIADPPYARDGRRDFAGELAVCDGLADRVVDGATLVFEVPGDWEFPGSPHWELLRERSYGRTRVVFLGRTGAG